MVLYFQAHQLNKDIFETIYYHALKSSAELAVKEGPYETYEGSPVSKVFLSPFQLLMLSVL
jgi:ribonucleoside-diphosphate reductase subunit M1